MVLGRHCKKLSPGIASLLAMEWIVKDVSCGKEEGVNPRPESQLESDCPKPITPYGSDAELGSGRKDCHVPIDIEAGYQQRRKALQQTHGFLEEAKVVDEQLKPGMCNHGDSLRSIWSLVAICPKHVSGLRACRKALGG
eukprot:2187129-Amphidinium_carterae.1